MNSVVLKKDKKIKRTYNLKESCIDKLEELSSKSDIDYSELVETAINHLYENATFIDEKQE